MADRAHKLLALYCTAKKIDVSLRYRRAPIAGSLPHLGLDKARPHFNFQSELGLIPRGLPRSAGKKSASYPAACCGVVDWVSTPKRPFYSDANVYVKSAPKEKCTRGGLAFVPASVSLV